MYLRQRTTTHLEMGATSHFKQAVGQPAPPTRHVTPDNTFIALFFFSVSLYTFRGPLVARLYRL